MKLTCTEAVFCVSFRLERLLLVIFFSQITAKSHHSGLPMLDFTPYCRQFLFSGQQIPRRFPSETASLVKISISLLQANNAVAGGALDSGNRPAPVGVTFSTR